MTPEPGPSAVLEVVLEPITGRLALLGEIESRRRPADAGTAILAGGSAEVVVDLARMRFIDAGGIRLLTALGNELAARNASARIVNPNARARYVFSLCGHDVDRVLLRAVPQTGGLTKTGNGSHPPAADRGRLAPPGPIPGTRG